MTKKINELTQVRDPTTPESIEIKRQFWEKMHNHLSKMQALSELWKKEDEDIRNL